MMPMNALAQRAFPMQPQNFAPPQGPQQIQQMPPNMGPPNMGPGQQMMPNPDAGNFGAQPQFGMRAPQMGLRPMPPVQIQQPPQQPTPTGMPMGAPQQMPQQPMNNIFAQRMARY